MRQFIHSLKYEGLRPVATRLGDLLATAIEQIAPQAPSEMLVVPVPLHRAKAAERGFNQSRDLAVAAVAALRERRPEWRLALAPSVLRRVRRTGTQAGLTTRQRRLNLRGAFAVSDPAAVMGKHILLIDDILTTGATARAASRALLQAGAESVWVATLARTDRMDHASSGVFIGTEASAGISAAEVSYQRANMNVQDQHLCHWGAKDVAG